MLSTKKDIALSAREKREIEKSPNNHEEKLLQLQCNKMMKNFVAIQETPKLLWLRFETIGNEERSIV